MNHVNDSIFLNELGRNFEHFTHREQRRFLDIRIRVAQNVLKRLNQVLIEFFDSDAAHRAHGHGADHRVVLVFDIADEGVDGHNGPLGQVLRVLRDVQVHELFDFDVVELETAHHAEEEGRYIFA